MLEPMMMRSALPSRNGLATFASWIKKDSIMAEIGSYAGESAKIFLDSGNVRLLFCVDPWEAGYDKSDIAADSDMEKVERLFDETLIGYNNYVKVKNKSRYASTMFPNGFFDLVYIDGNHQYDAVMEDLRLWIPKIKSGGWCTGHDFLPDVPNHQVAPALFDFFGSQPWSAFEDRSWIYKI